jgi:hypothetical protein
LQKKTPQGSPEKIDISKYLSKGDTLFVIHFHPTVQCSCCINVEKNTTPNHTKRDALFSRNAILKRTP